MTDYLAPAPWLSFTDNNGNPLSGGLLFTYLSNTTTKSTTYTDASGATPNTNPIVLDSYGQCDCWLPPGQQFTFTLSPSTDTDPPTNIIKSRNNISSGGGVATINFATDTGLVNASVAAVAGIASLFAGLTITLDVAITNTGPATLNVNGLGPKPIVLQNGGFVGGGVLQAGGQYLLQYTGSAWMILGVSITPDKVTTPLEIASGVTPTNYAYDPGQPERYIASGFVYCSDGTASNSPTDFAPAINTALSIAGQPVILSESLYCIKSTLTMPPEQSMYGAGLNETGIVCASTFTGVGINWNGAEASKIGLQEFTLYCNTPSGAAVTGGIVLGNSVNPYGTEGYIHNVMVRDTPAGVLAFDIFGNVGEFGNIYALQSGGIRIQGSANTVLVMENSGCTGYLLQGVGLVGTIFQDGTIHFYELEAPNSSIIPVYLSGNGSIENLTIGFSYSTTYAELVYLSSSTSTWEVNLRKLYYKGQSGTFGTYTNVFYDQAANVSFGPGNLLNTTSSHAGEGNYSSGLMTQGSQFGFQKQQLNAFTIRLTNASGTLKHAIGAVGSATGNPANVATCIPSATDALTTTPQGSDATTAFAAGAKISSAATNTLVLDMGYTGPQQIANFVGLAVISFNSSTVALTVAIFTESIDIDGVTAVRLCLSLQNATTGAAVPWTTALGTSGYIVDIGVLGFFT